VSDSEKEGHGSFKLNLKMITIIVSLQDIFTEIHRFADFLFYRIDIHLLDSYFLQRESETLKEIITTSEIDSIHLKNVSVARFRALRRFLRRVSLCMQP
jgi:hypothetical protein